MLRAELVELNLPLVSWKSFNGLCKIVLPFNGLYQIVLPFNGLYQIVLKDILQHFSPPGWVIFSFLSQSDDWLNGQLEEPFNNIYSVVLQPIKLKQLTFFLQTYVAFYERYVMTTFKYFLMFTYILKLLKRCSVDVIMFIRKIFLDLLCYRGDKMPNSNHFLRPL